MVRCTRSWDGWGGLWRVGRRGLTRGVLRRGRDGQDLVDLGGVSLAGVDFCTEAIEMALHDPVTEAFLVEMAGFGLEKKV